MSTLAETLAAQYGPQPIDPDCVEDGVEFLECIFDGSLGLDYTNQRLINMANGHGASIAFDGDNQDGAEEAEEFLNSLLENTRFLFVWSDGDLMLARTIDGDE